MNFFRIIKMAQGLSSYLPGGNFFCPKDSGKTYSARYCYSVWLRHLRMAQVTNKIGQVPSVVAELGPGMSLGVGLAALLTGCEKYYAFDVVRHANVELNLKIFDELIILFTNRTRIPDENELPNVKPFLENYDFPEDILSDELMSLNFSPARLALIRDSIKNEGSAHSLIQYVAPWSEIETIKQGTVDLIISQAVLEHIDDLDHAYAAMRLWLHPSGFLSHQIDFKCHGTAKDWNGHWTYSELTWKVIRGARHYLINRSTYSDHINYLNKNGFLVKHEKKVTTPSTIQKSDLADKFKRMPDSDMNISGVFIQATPFNAHPKLRR
ncbi:hypothetical protein CBP51_05100 [Cellvibrio mixtus]|uniref:Methyltransferase type 11 domain-containing protein n=1 Tax=Cellvibrio mixtus TaxID=39650 RepID=A0A266Q934_9GAMM|nr:methyltransferase domain-containing protein [Cellvibrio mixtus]OZY86407.1 hypothetical protein CBP51_05100 [Cellvibrio mixtus]